MQQPPRFNPPPVPQSVHAELADGYDAYGHEAHYDEHADYDPAGALGGHRDYHESEAAYYAAAEHSHAPPPAPPAMPGSTRNASYPPIQPQHAAPVGHDAYFDDEDDVFAAHYEAPRVMRRPPPRRSNPLVLGAVAVVGMLVLGVGSVFAYRAVAGSNGTGANAPLIRADTKPMKEMVVAQQPPAAAGPNLDVARANGQDKLVTQTEDPVDQIPGKPVRVVGTGMQNPSLAPVQRVRSVIVRPDGSIVTPDDVGAKPAPVVPPVRTASLPTPADTPVVPATPAPVVQVQVAPVSPAPPAPVQQVHIPAQVVPSPSVPPPGAVANVDQVPVVPKPVPAPVVIAPPKPVVAHVPPPVAVPVQPPVAAVQPPPAKPVKPLPALVPHAPAPVTDGPLALGPSSGPAQATPAQIKPVQTEPVHVASATLPAPIVPTPHVTAPVEPGTGDYMVQISSQRSDAEAHHALQTAVQKYASLGAKGGDVQQADLGARGTYYRARIAGGTHEQALAMCSQIKAQGGDCVVSKR